MSPWWASESAREELGQCVHVYPENGNRWQRGKRCQNWATHDGWCWSHAPHLQAQRSSRKRLAADHKRRTAAFRRTHDQLKPADALRIDRWMEAGGARALTLMPLAAHEPQEHSMSEASPYDRHRMRVIEQAIYAARDAGHNDPIDMSYDIFAALQADPAPELVTIPPEWFRSPEQIKVTLLKILQDAKRAGEL